MIDFGAIATKIAKTGLKAMGMGLGGIVIGAIMDKGMNALEGRNAVSIPTDAIKPDDPGVVETEATVAGTETEEIPTEEPEVETETETPTEQEVEA